MTIKMKLVILLCVFISMGIWANIAGSATMITVDPARIEILVKPGVSTTGAILVSNPGTEPLRLGAEVRDWNMNAQGEPVFAHPRDRTDSCAGWIRFNPRVTLLNPGKQQIIRYSITAPKGVSSGEYRAAVIFAVEAADDAQENLSISSSIATTIYANVGPIQRRGELLSSSATYSEGIMTVKSIIKSKGNAHLRLNGSFLVTDANGNTVGEGRYRGKAIFPGQERELVGEWKGKLEKGTYRIRNSFRYIPSLYAENMAEYNHLRGLDSSVELNVE